jgi:hypothetical protein
MVNNGLKNVLKKEKIEKDYTTPHPKHTTPLSHSPLFAPVDSASTKHRR